MAAALENGGGIGDFSNLVGGESAQHRAPTTGGTHTRGDQFQVLNWQRHLRRVNAFAPAMLFQARINVPAGGGIPGDRADEFVAIDLHHRALPAADFDAEYRHGDSRFYPDDIVQTNFTR
ncbi:MAG: hypothetical protein BWY76_01473 [bacterium ADurb.Bin429]|nr:MAG: hypothetical protein BWY76_01473 [bacterium ADurb.Bin429]